MKLKIKDKKIRTWILTYYPTDDVKDLQWFKDLGKKRGIRYYVAGREHCPTTGRLHYQIYISFKNGKTMKETKRWFGTDKIWMKPGAGQDGEYDEHNQSYVSKEKRFVEIGKPLKQGKRSDIERAINVLKETNSMASVLDTVMNYQAVRHSELWLKYKEPPRPRQTINVIWIYGSTGCGKTKHVFDTNPLGDNIFQPTTYKWWEGYDGHSHVLIDDIRRDFCSFQDLLQLCDVYPFRRETKGGSRQVQYTTIYFTAPESPLTMWEHRCISKGEDIDQLLRRITQTINMDEL